LAKVSFLALFSFYVFSVYPPQFFSLSFGPVTIAVLQPPDRPAFFLVHEYGLHSHAFPQVEENLLSTSTVDLELMHIGLVVVAGLPQLRSVQRRCRAVLPSRPLLGCSDKARPDFPLPVCVSGRGVF